MRPAGEPEDFRNLGELATLVTLGKGEHSLSSEPRFSPNSSAVSHDAHQILSIRESLGTLCLGVREKHSSERAGGHPVLPLYLPLSNPFCLNESSSISVFS